MHAGANHGRCDAVSSSNLSSFLRAYLRKAEPPQLRSLRLLITGDGHEMVGDGIAVAASVAQFSPTSELRVSRAFRDALADAAPGLEASLVPKGAFHELYTRDRTELQRRKRTYNALTVAVVFGLLGTSVAWGISQHGKEAFVDGLAAKYRATTVHGERYVRALVQKAKFQ